MRKTLAILVIISFCMTSMGPFVGPGSNSGGLLFAAAEPMQGPGYQDTGGYAYFSPEQLDNLVGPVALYPDPLLAQVLLASTFVDQIPEAAQWVAEHNDPHWIDSQPWDVSVKAVAHYPSVLYMMRDRIDWTTTLGQAYVNQSTDVMVAVQRLRQMARSSGYLVSGPQQQVYAEGPYVRIVPYNPRYIYVPVYDPAVVYYRRAPGAVVAAAVISFGAGLIIGAWLNHDCDWHGHRVFYHGWVGGGWIGRSRTNIHVTNIYVNNNYRNVHINRTVVDRKVDYRELNHYSSVHRDVNYDRVNRHPGGRPSDRHQANTSIPRNEGKRGPEPVTHRTERVQPRPPSKAAVTPPAHTPAWINTPDESKRVSHGQPPPQRTEHRTVQPQAREHTTSRSPEKVQSRKIPTESKAKSDSKAKSEHKKAPSDSNEKGKQ